MRLTELYKKLNDKPLIENEKTYGDLSPEEWDEMRADMGMKTDDEGNQYIDKKDSPSTSRGKYDPGNEPLEIQHVETGLTYFINVEDIEAYVSGEEVIAVDPDRGEDAIRVTREETDVVGVSEDELEDFMVSGDRSADDVINEYDTEAADDNEDDDIKGQPFPAVGEGICTEQEVEEGTCGHALDGDVDVYNTDNMTPAGPHLFYLDEEKQQLQESKMVSRFKKLANIK
jgi:hypothetical protein